MPSPGPYSPRCWPRLGSSGRVTNGSNRPGDHGRVLAAHVSIVETKGPRAGPFRVELAGLEPATLGAIQAAGVTTGHRSCLGERS
jgi:hypothetical protein